MLVCCGLQYWELRKDEKACVWTLFLNIEIGFTFLKIKKSPYTRDWEPEQGLTFSLKSKDKLTDKD
jgi:hypothetical protein